MLGEWLLWGGNGIVQCSVITLFLCPDRYSNCISPTLHEETGPKGTRSTIWLAAGQGPCQPGPKQGRLGAAQSPDCQAGFW